MKLLILSTLLLFPVTLCTAEPLTKNQLIARLHNSDLTDWAEQNAINFPKLVKGCLNDKDARSQIQSWKLLTFFLSIYGADGAAGDELNVSVGPNLAKLVSTERLHNIISKLSKTERAHIPFSLIDRFRYSSLDAKAKSDFNKKHPITATAIKEEIKRNNNVEKAQ